MQKCVTKCRDYVAKDPIVLWLTAVICARWRIDVGTYMHAYYQQARIPRNKTTTSLVKTLLCTYILCMDNSP